MLRVLLVGDLAGDVGDDRAVSAQIARMLCETGEGVEIDADVDAAAGAVGSLSGEEVEVDVGTQLVHGARLPGGVERAGKPVDAVHRRGDAVGWKVEAQQVGGSRFGRFADDAPFLEAGFVAVLGVVGVGVDAQSAEAGAELAGGEPGRFLDDAVHHRVERVVRQVGGGVGDDPGPTDVDVAARQQVPYAGETVAEPEGGFEFGIGGAAGERQRQTDLGGGGLGGFVRVIEVLVGGVGDGGHIAVELGGVMGDEPATGPQNNHPVMTRQHPDVDSGQEGGEDRTRFHLVQAGRNAGQARFDFRYIEHMFDDTKRL